MSFQLVITPDAQRDIDETHAWYEQKQGGVGHRFILALRGRFGSILLAPDYPMAFGRKSLRKVNIPGWPYSIYYQILEEEVRVVAVVHGARDPKYLNYRLR